VRRWKTIGDPIVNALSRYSALNLAPRAWSASTTSPISDRSPETNFRDCRGQKNAPDRAVIVLLMVDTRERWHEFTKRAQPMARRQLPLTGCPHGMCERGMGSAVGQQPAVTEKSSVAMEAATMRIVKLTPTITDASMPGAPRKRAVGTPFAHPVDRMISLDTLVPEPFVAGRSTHGGYCGPAVKPIALNMVQSCAADPDIRLPISGIGGISNWRDAAEFIALGSTSVQVCTAIMHYGFRIVEDMTEGLNDYLDSKGYKSVTDLVGKAVPALQKWETLDLHYQRVARISYDKCIGCNLCYIACEDGAHQCIDLVSPNGHGLGPGRVPGKPIPKVREEDCVGCNLCSLVCPVDEWITMVSVSNGEPKMSWTDYQARMASGEMQPIPPHP
jgi:dihydropyrimidine dehydrogenase (NAD+) subunit PreA